MLKQLLKTIKSAFTATTYHNELEQYIISHNPQTVLDVEQLERQFEAHRASRQNRFAPSYF